LAKILTTVRSYVFYGHGVVAVIVLIVVVVVVVAVNLVYGKKKKSHNG